MAKDRRQRRLERARTIGVENAVSEPEIVGNSAFAFGLSERVAGAVQLEPPGLAQIAVGPAFRHQRLVLGERLREQGPHQLRRLDQALRRRPGAISEQPGRDARQECEVVIRLRREARGDAQERRRIARKGTRKQRIPFDDAGVAVGGPFAWAALVDQRHREPALDKLQGDGRADDAGAEHDNVGARHDLLRLLGIAV